MEWASDVPTVIRDLTHQLKSKSMNRSVVRYLYWDVNVVTCLDVVNTRLLYRDIVFLSKEFPHFAFR